MPKSVILVPVYDNLNISGPYLGERIYDEVERIGDEDFEIVYVDIINFRDTSEKIQIHESIRGKDVYIIHPLYVNMAQHSLIAAEIGQAARMADAGRVVLVDLYNGYFRQDRKTAREPVTARLIAELYEDAGISHVFTLEAHTEQVQMAFSADCPIETLPTTKLMGDYLLENFMFEEKDSVVCSPDTGGVKRARALANYLGLPLTVIHKRKIKEGKVETMEVVGEVAGKDVFIRDDVTSTFSTLINAADSLKERGANDIYACVTHLNIDDEAKQRMMDSGIKIIGTNTIPVEFTEEEMERVDLIDVAPLLACVIFLRTKGESIGDFFEASKN